MRKIEIRLAVYTIGLGLLASILWGCATGGQTQVLDVSAEPLPQEADESASAPTDMVNDLSRFLSGLKGGNGAPWAEQRKTYAWEGHRQAMRDLWYLHRGLRGKEIGDWSRANIGDLRSRRVVFYPFSGPDLLYPDILFPNANVYVLAGLESCELLPDMRTMSPEEIAHSLNAVRASMDSLLRNGYFQTKEMRSHFARSTTPS